MSRALTELSIAQARQIALAAQGFDTPRPKGKATQQDVASLFTRLGVIQIDSVNVLVRSQELPLFARLGNHDRQAIPNLTKQRKIFEYWGHEAAHLPVALHSLFRWKMHAARDGTTNYWSLSSFYKQNTKFVEKIYQQIAANGPTTAREISTRTKKKSSWWDWDDSKMALEFLFLAGQLMAASRGTDFARAYDITERVLPKKIIDTPTPTEHQARKQLLVHSAKAQGVATSRDLADYYRQKFGDVKSIISELVEEKTLVKVDVESWQEPAYIHSATKVPKQLFATALLSPFDSLVWCRPRNERLFNFHYRIELYTPKEKRKFGYYVLPFMVDGQLVGRVDLKSDRETSTLLVNSVHTEQKIKRSQINDSLVAEVREMASWLGLEHIKLVGRVL